MLRHGLDELVDREPVDSLGAYLEFGVSRGTSLAAAYGVITERGLDHIAIAGFDSFEGLPDDAAHNGWEPGSFRSTISATKRYLTGRGVDLDRISLVQGWFDDTLHDTILDDLGIAPKVSIAMIDCDTYSSSATALRFVEPLIRSHAVVILDDWAAGANLGRQGQREAFEDVIGAAHDLSRLELESYSEVARVFLVSRHGHEGQDRAL